MMNKEIAYLIALVIALFSPLIEDKHVLVRLFGRWFFMLWIIATISMSLEL